MVKLTLSSQGFVVVSPSATRFVKTREGISGAITAVIFEHNALIGNPDQHIDADDVYTLEVFSKGWVGRVYDDGSALQLASLTNESWDRQFQEMQTRVSDQHR